MNNIYLKVAANRIEIEKDTFTTGGSVDFDGCVFSFEKRLCSDSATLTL